MKDLIETYNKMHMTKKELKYRLLPDNYTLEEFWSELVKTRKKTAIIIPLKDQTDNYFWFNLTPTIKKNIELIESAGTKDVFKSIPPEIKTSTIVESIIDEAYNSSVIEGAFSTKKRTKELVEKNLNPTNKSEKMIVNNYHALQYILDNLDNPLNEDTIISIYQILTQNTLEENEVVDKYRNDFVGVWSTKKNKYIYKAPPYENVQTLMTSLNNFIGNSTNLHPLIKACIIHFYFVYIHPFFDGNGRTARAISYMYLLQEGYDFFKFFSISSLIKEERNKYYSAIENTEIYDSDLTYFIDYYLDMITKSILKVMDDLKKEYGKRITRDMLDKAGIILNNRQIKIINNFMGAKKNIITINQYRKKFNISYETARTDLNDLSILGIFQRAKIGKQYLYKFNEINKIFSNLEKYIETFS